jgi:hypothetical protein
MRIRFLLSWAAASVICYSATAQPIMPGQFNVKESLMESVLSIDRESVDYEAILNELEYLQKHPINLNEAQQEEFQKLPFLTDFQITSLLEYREENGKLLSVYELPLINGFTDEVISMMLPYVMVPNQEIESDFRLREMVNRSNHEIVLRTQRVLEEARGYNVYDSTAGDMRYPGNPWLYNAGYEFSFKNHLQAGLTVEKDPGEDFFKGSNPGGFDFNSAFVMVKDMGLVKSAIVGDFRLAFGQGLTLWSGQAPGKSSLPMNIVKRQDAVKAFSSADENNYFRGAAAAATWGKFTFTAFYSSKKRDANITDTLAPDRICFSSFQEGGYHRTRSETADEKSVREEAFGGNLLFRNNFIKAGTTLVYYQFDKYMKSGNDLRDIHDFQGNNLLNWGIDYSLTLNKLQFFGETSYGNDYWATLNGALLQVNKYASFSLLYRNFGAGYYSLHSSAFSESSSASNEEAIYVGLVIHPVAKWKISGYADFYRFPWLKFGVSAPASGTDYLLQVDYAMNKRIGMYFRVKYVSDPEDGPTNSQLIPEITELQHTGVRYQISYRVSEKITMQNRLEISIVNPDVAKKSNGILLYHDIEYRAEKVPLIFDFRFAWFNTDDYNSRIYAYEQDMTAGFSFSPLYDEGYRSYLMARYDITRQLSCRVRLSQTRFFNKDFISSGYDLIDSNTRTEIKLQLVARL